MNLSLDTDDPINRIELDEAEREWFNASKLINN
jgi:hypothetical protein